MYLKRHNNWTIQLEEDKISYKFMHHCQGLDYASTVASVVRICNRCKAPMLDEEWNFFKGYVDFIFPWTKKEPTIVGISKTTYPIIKK